MRSTSHIAVRKVLGTHRPFLHFLISRTGPHCQWAWLGFTLALYKEMEA